MSEFFEAVRNIDWSVDGTMSWLVAVIVVGTISCTLQARR